MHSALVRGLLEPRGSKLALLKSTFNAENFIRKLSWSSVILAQFNLEMCGSLKSRKIYENFLFLKFKVVQCHRCLLVPPESSPTVLVMISSKSVSICNRSHARRTNSGDVTIS